MSTTRKRLTAALCALLFFTAMPSAVSAKGGADNGTFFGAVQQAAAVIAEEKQTVDKIMDGMSEEEKILQLFIVDPEELDRDVPRVTESTETLKKRLAEYPVGGVIFFAENLKNPRQTRSMLTSMNQQSVKDTGLPLFLCVDEEGGRVARVSSNDSFGLEKTGPMNTIRSADEAGRAGSYIGAYLYMLGFNMNLAPVADVLTVSGNTSIGDRSFGNDPQHVTELAGAFSDGLHACRIMSTYKHFPGDGSTASDTHQGFAYTEKTLDELMKCELVPFASAAEKKADAVMTAHISVPSVTGDNTPASLSGELTTGVLRKKLGYKGLIITDSLEMGAIIQNYTSSQAAVGAISAGADLILQPDDFQEALWGLKQAVKNGEISKDRLDESVRRIIIAKRKLLAHF